MKNRTLSIIATPCIPYRKELRQVAGSVTGSILMLQLDYWFSKYPNGFYKFLAKTPKHPDYRDGDSWTEELGFSEAEFRTAFDQIGVRHPSKSAYKKAVNHFAVANGEKFYCSYHDKQLGLTWYFRNHQKVDEIIEVIFETEVPESQKRPFTVTKESSSTGDEQSQSTVTKESSSTVDVVSESLEINKVNLQEINNLELHSIYSRLHSSETTHKITQESEAVLNESKQEKLSDPKSNPPLIKKPESSGKQITSLEGNFSAAAPRVNATRQYTKPPVEPFGRPRPSGKDYFWAWLPEGDWVVNGELDPKFWDWMATSWVNNPDFKTTYPKAKADVINHFTNRPQQLPLKWNEYCIEKSGKESFTPLPDAVRDWQQVQHLLIWEQYNNCKDLEHFYSLRSWNRAYLEYALEHLPNFDWSKHLTTVSA